MWVSLTCSPEHTARQCRNFTFPAAAVKWQNCCYYYYMDPSSIEAGIYEAWQREIMKSIKEIYVPSIAKELFRSLPLKRVIDWLLSPDGKFGENPIKGRDQFLIQSLERSTKTLTKKLGPNMDKWVYGQKKYKLIMLRIEL